MPRLVWLRVSFRWIVLSVRASECLNIFSDFLFVGITLSLNLGRDAVKIFGTDVTNGLYIFSVGPGMSVIIIIVAVFLSPRMDQADSKFRWDVGISFRPLGVQPTWLILSFLRICHMSSVSTFIKTRFCAGHAHLSSSHQLSRWLLAQSALSHCPSCCHHAACWCQLKAHCSLS